jgi:phage tail sheath protein FI
LSKASDAEFSVGNPSYWRKYIANNSQYIFGLGAPTGIVTTGYSSGFTLESDVAWDQEAEGITFAAAGASTNTLTGGKDYSGAENLDTAGSLTATLGELSDGYDLFENTENFKVDFLLMGSAAYDISTAQALANKLISVAELRKDAIAFISPYRGAALSDTSVQTAVTVRSAADITDNVVEFYAPVASSSYAIFDSGYKYMYDRFANTFRYVPLNGDIAGLCARNDINNFAWYSPAGTSRGAILNAVKLAYNPTKTQRDKLYSNRVNPVIFSPGAGIILFGDKTGLAKASAFDRINVRRLFVYLENAISQAAKDALFEFNDEITRTNFVNTIEPFLRDVQAKRGIFDYVVICDETNNTAAVIDNNEFIADIYIKPARSINFIGLNFIATKTGVDFEEVIGNF